MKRYKSILSIIISLSILTGCSTRAVDNTALVSAPRDFKLELDEEKEIQQASNNSEQKKHVQAPEIKTSPEKVPEAKPKTQPKSNNSAKKVIAQAPNKAAPPAKPNVTSTVEKIEIPVPPAQNTTVNSATKTTATAQETQTNTAVQTSSTADTSGTTSSLENIPGLPPLNYEVNNYSEYYKAIYSSLKNFETSTYIKLNKYDNKVYNLSVIDDIVANDYDVDYALKSVRAAIYTMGDINVLNVKFQYGATKDKLLAMRDAADGKAVQIIDQIIKPGMNDLEKEKAIHDYVVTHTSYDYDNYLKGTLPLEVFNAYGVFINGSAVCEGYSKAMLKLLKMAGLEAKSVVGYGIDGTNKIAHAWNMVKINGAYTLVDATWDDPVPDQKDKVYYDYFDISDADMAKDHQWDTSKYPKAVAVSVNIQQ